MPALTSNPTKWPIRRSSDNLGTVRDLAEYDDATDTTAIVDHYVYDAFGNETSGTLDFLFAYTGRAFDDETGLQNNLNRWFNPVVGRWLSEDLIGFEAGDANVYRYVGNSSTLATDPTGLQPAGIVNKNNSNIAVVILTDKLPGTESVHTNSTWEQLANSIGECWQGKVHVLRISDHLKVLQGLKNNQERRNRIESIIKTFVADTNSATLYIIGHRGWSKNEGGAVTYLDKTDDPYTEGGSTKGKVLVLKGGPDGTDKQSRAFVRDLANLGVTHLNLFTCAGESSINRKVQKTVHKDFASWGVFVAGSVESAAAYAASTFVSGGNRAHPFTFGNPKPGSKYLLPQRRWIPSITSPPGFNADGTPIPWKEIGGR